MNIRLSCIALLLAILSAGCRSEITEDYVLKNPKLKKVVLEMTTDRAIEVVRHDFNTNKYEADELTSIDELGISYDHKYKFALEPPRTVYMGIGYKVVEQKFTAGTAHVRLKFSDVARLNLCHDIAQLWLLDANSEPSFHRFELGGIWGYSQGTSYYEYTKDEIDELVASLLVLCPNTHRGWTRLPKEWPSK